MKHSQMRTAGAFLILVLLLSVGLTGAAAAEPAGSGPDSALAPPGDWEQLDPGQIRWYSFTYAGDGSAIQVQLQVVPEDSSGFVVWTPDQIYHRGLGEYVEPIGRGSLDPHAATKLQWAGSFTDPGTYYVVVEHAGTRPGTSYYLLDVSGSGVSLSESAPAPALVPAPASAQSQANAAPAGDPAGTLVFQTSYGGPIYTIDVDGSDLQRVTNGIDPVWSPSGEQIALVRWEEPRGVWIVDVETGNEWRAFDWSETRYPSWSPDGSQIVFSRQYGVIPRPSRPSRPMSASEPVGSEATVLGRPDFGGGRSGGPGSATWNLGIINVWDDTFAEPQPDSTINLTPDWSPNSEQIVYGASAGLRVMSVDGKTSYALTQNPKDTSPAWSPDGTKVAFVYRQHDHWEVYVVDVNTGQQTRLTDTPTVNGVPANSVSPAWSPDGSHIAFLTDRTGSWEIWSMKADGSAEMPMFDTELDGLMLDYAYAGERAIDWTW